MWYETLKVLYKPFSPVRNLKKGFVGEDSSPRYTGRTFKGFVDFFILFLRLWKYLDAFRHLPNLFWGFGKIPIFLQCTPYIFSLTQAFPYKLNSSIIRFTKFPSTKLQMTDVQNKRKVSRKNEKDIIITFST